MHTSPDSQRLVSLAWIAARWGCSRSSVRRILRRAGVPAVALSDARNGLVRFDREAVLRVEQLAQRSTGRAPVP